MKRLIFASFLLLSLTLSAKAAINEKVLKAFNETFQNAKDVQWHEFASTYQVSFKQNDVATTVTYDRKGNIIEARRYSKADILPLVICQKLQKRFGGKAVWGVTEVVQGGSAIYRIVLHDDKQWYVLDYDAVGSLLGQERYNKA